MYQLRPYQQEAVDSTLRHFRKSRHPAVIVLPTGAGKSLVIAELARIARGRVLVLAHVKELVEQNYGKFKAYGLDAGIYSAGLNQKDSDAKVIFGSIQSVARAEDSFFKDFSLLVIDECHRVSDEGGTQYAQVVQKVLLGNRDICILGLTATPYRLDSGWIYQFNHAGFLRTSEPRLFKKCVFELSLKKMIDDGFLTPPVQIDAPVASYDFSSLLLQTGRQSFNLSEIEELLKDQSRVTPVIIQNIVDLSKDRRGVIIFTSSVRHAAEIMRLLPAQHSAIVLGDTPGEERDTVIDQFKARTIKFLVNVSVLTTGFDAPHVDVIAILRPTESVSLYQQIVGRGLRLFEGKHDCLVLDYTGVPHDIFTPQIHDRRPTDDAVPVRIECPNCNHENDFWGITGASGELLEHFGKKCSGAVENPDNGEIVPCGFRYRYRTCELCGTENDIDAPRCAQCSTEFADDESRIKDAMAYGDAHVMRPDSMSFERKVDKKGLSRLEIRYYDLNAQHLSEVYFFESENDSKVFHYNFSRMHNRIPERRLEIRSIDDALKYKDAFRLPLFVIARKQDRFWKIREKLFMTTPMKSKSSIEEIRTRFDGDVERFSSLETGQAATIDAPLAMDLITQAAIATTPHIGSVLDIGCGAGNNTIKLRQAFGSDFDADLLDLSEPMLARAGERLAAVNKGRIRKIGEDFRTAEIPDNSYDVLLAAAVLHHLREDADWREAFSKIFRILKPGGSVSITDLVTHETGAVQEMMWRRYGEYLSALGGQEYRARVFAYIDKEDSPRPVTFQLDLLRSVGFSAVELLHKNSCFAAFGAVKSDPQ